MSNTKFQKEKIRELIWNTLKPYALPPFPIRGRIPNFKGAREAAERLRGLRERASAEVVKANPDSPQRWARLAALEEGKVLIMATPRLREGFLLIDPNEVPREKFKEASTIRGAFKWGRKLKTVDDLLNNVKRVDFVVEGSVAVDLEGRRVGKGAGYGDLEFGILTELGLMDVNVPIATTVHDVQVLEGPLPQDPWDVPLTFASTPTRLLKFKPLPRPRGVLWEALDERKLEEIPLLKELKGLRGGGAAGI
ncbi:5-formyltetrahydrofolate cyclo-ligase [Ignicoccus hospitalis]|uniref:5-formyltetrahydrofolate cyclo-ligase n=1 Tax=Ignicoccus hospitalis (strain KIN4/I / DSM 18386 / JCM 14125) TaxID=453591 RepID=A8A9E1_IGNH4|nr:5-formyltetrahydrofolate cyclo-ligase [Ignicoccus hospitalis]ABU81543.1 5-formyltetrahydrofolate cyclo-ligase [Ignicoccus hospitalis KIN4/I]HIH90478.1 5-formyltetrahydrofolate cyclo-ligase [Desulfurococcaceae archaeon]